MVIKFLIKSGLVYGAVQYSIDQGVWASSVKTTELYGAVVEGLCPHWTIVKQKIPLELHLLPSSVESCFVAKFYWNQSVKGTFNFIHRLPCHIGQWTKRAKNAIGDAFSSFEEVPTSKDK